MLIELTDQTWQGEIAEFKGVALVDFWAPWCGPCKMQGPIIEELAKELSGKDNIKIAKLNVDENQSTSQANEIMSIPTLKIFKDGKVVDEMIGVQSKDVLQNKINKFLN